MQPQPFPHAVAQDEARIEHRDFRVLAPDERSIQIKAGFRIAGIVREILASGHGITGVLTHQSSKIPARRTSETTRGGRAGLDDHERGWRSSGHGKSIELGVLRNRSAVACGLLRHTEAASLAGTAIPSGRSDVSEVEELHTADGAWF